MKRPMELLESEELYALYRLCETFHTLPLTGGLLDQDCVLVHMFSIIVALHAERAEAEQARRQG